MNLKEMILTFKALKYPNGNYSIPFKLNYRASCNFFVLIVLDLIFSGVLFPQKLLSINAFLKLNMDI